MKKCISYSKKFKGLLKGIGIKKKIMGKYKFSS